MIAHHDVLKLLIWCKTESKYLSNIAEVDEHEMSIEQLNMPIFSNCSPRIMARIVSDEYYNTAHN